MTVARKAALARDSPSLYSSSVKWFAALHLQEGDSAALAAASGAVAPFPLEITVGDYGEPNPARARGSAAITR